MKKYKYRKPTKQDPARLCDDRASEDLAWKVIVYIILVLGLLYFGSWIF